MLGEEGAWNLGFTEQTSLWFSVSFNNKHSFNMSKWYAMQNNSVNLLPLSPFHFQYTFKRLTTSLCVN